MSSVKFCPDCSNMLYPREDRQERKLLYACRNCEHQEDADQYCIYRNQIAHRPAEQIQVVLDVASDPTLPRTRQVQCPRCQYREAVYFESRARRADTAMTLYYVCCNAQCNHRWVDPSGM